MIESGSHINARSNWDNTRVISAAYGGYTDTDELLIKNGSDSNATGKNVRNAVKKSDFIDEEIHSTVTWTKKATSKTIHFLHKANIINQILK